MNTVKMIIFDMDGVLVDSEPLHLRAKQKIISQLNLGKPIDPTMYIGMTNEKMWGQVILDNGLDIQVEDLLKIQYSMILSWMKSEKLKETPNLTQFLTELKGLGIKI
jgi:beta-phosphoglucomutase-like phosphatase (HAD superfamily)